MPKSFKAISHIMPHEKFLFLMRTTRIQTPYPLPLTTYENNTLHDAILSNDTDTIRDMDADLFVHMMTQESYHNTPLALAVKLGQFETISVLLKKMQDTLSKAECQATFHKRDSMGLMPISYLMLLKAPYDIIKAALYYTDKKAFYTDSSYSSCIEGLTDDESSQFNISEKGYKHRESHGGFALYTFPLQELYVKPLPEKLKVYGEIIESQNFIIQTSEDDHFSLWHQVLRNIIFHVDTLCQNMCDVATMPDSEILRDCDKYLFHINENYPKLKDQLNHRYDERVEQLLNFWNKLPLGRSLLTISMEQFEKVALASKPPKPSNP